MKKTHIILVSVLALFVDISFCSLMSSTVCSTFCFFWGWSSTDSMPLLHPSYSASRARFSFSRLGIPGYAFPRDRAYCDKVVLFFLCFVFICIHLCIFILLFLGCFMVVFFVFIFLLWFLFLLFSWLSFFILFSVVVS